MHYLSVARLSTLAALSAYAFASAEAKEACRAVSDEKVMTEWNYYLSLPETKRSGESDLYECISVTLREDSRIVCLTKPANPAHLSIVIRRVFEKDGAVWIDMSSNTTTFDCTAFFRMMDDFKNLNQKVRDEMQRKAAQ